MGGLLAWAANRTAVCHRMAASWRTRHCSSDVNLIQNKHNGLNFPYPKNVIRQKVYVMTDHYQTGNMDIINLDFLIDLFNIKCKTLYTYA